MKTTERTVRLAAAALAAAFLLVPGAHAQYKWVDPQGRVVYGDNPPREAHDVQRVDARGASGDADALAGLPYETRRAAQKYPVVLYTVADCPPCESGRQLLRARGVPYSERTISSKEDSDRLKSLGYGERLPVVSVGGQVQKEFQTTAWHAALDAAGYPRSGQLPRGWQPTVGPLVPRPAAPAPADQERAAAPGAAEKSN